MNGSKLLEVCKYNYQLCAAVIALSDDPIGLINSIESPDLRKNIAIFTALVLDALGKDNSEIMAIAKEKVVMA